MATSTRATTPPAMSPAKAKVHDDEEESLALARVLQEQEQAFWLLAHGGSGMLDDEAAEDEDQQADWGTDGEHNEDLEEGPIDDEELCRRLQEEEDRQAYRQYLGMLPQAEEAAATVAPIDSGIESWSYEQLTALGEVVGAVSRGVSQHVIEAVPTTQYGDLVDSNRAALDKCCICQVEFERLDTVKLLPCQHYYHPDCVATWLGINKACCVCSKEVTAEGAASA